MRNARTVVTRERALDEVWGAAAVENVVDRYVGDLRRKLGEPAPDPHRARRRLRAGAMSRAARCGCASRWPRRPACSSPSPRSGIAAQQVVDHELHAAAGPRRCATRADDVARLSASAPALLDRARRARRALGRAGAARGGGRPPRADRRALGARSAGACSAPARQVRRAIARGRTGYAGGELSGEPLRLFAAPLPDAGRPGARRRGARRGLDGGEIERTAERVRTLILLCALSPPRCSAPLLAAALTGRGLAPLRRLTRPPRGDRAHRRRRPSACRPPTGGEVGELAAHAQRDARRARARARGRAALPRRRLARAAHAAHGAARERRLRRPPRRRPRGARRPAAPTPSALARLVDDLLALERPTTRRRRAARRRPRRPRPRGRRRPRATPVPPTRPRAWSCAATREALRRARRQPRRQRARPRARRR